MIRPSYLPLDPLIIFLSQTSLKPFGPIALAEVIIMPMPTPPEAT
jgi:hypothetical protein